MVVRETEGREATAMRSSGVVLTENILVRQKDLEVEIGQVVKDRNTQRTPMALISQTHKN